MADRIEVTLARQMDSMSHGLVGLPPEVEAVIQQKYGIRDALQGNNSSERPNIAIWYDHTNIRHRSGLVPILDWHARYLDRNFNFIDDPKFARQLMAGVNGHRPEDTSLFLNKHRLMDYDLQVESYFTTQDLDSEYVRYVGVDADEARAAKDKANFSHHAVEASKSSDPKVNFALPYQELIGGKPNADVLVSTLNHYQTIYDSILAQATEVERIAISQNLKLGIVLRPANMDGGFGNIFLLQNKTENDDNWLLKTDDHEFSYASLEEAIAAIDYGDEQFPGLTHGWNYVMTRFCELAAMPSNGVRFDGREFSVKQVTAQVQVDKITIAGGSYNIADDKFTAILEQELIPGLSRRERIQEISHILAYRLFTPEKQRQRGQFGFDFGVVGTSELAMIDIIRRTPDLQTQFGCEFAEVIAFECNPRETLISGVVGVLARAVRKSSRKASLAVTAADIDDLYNGCGAFFVHDFVDCPESWLAAEKIKSAGEIEKQTSLTQGMLAYIDAFNLFYEGAMVMIPRVDAYYKSPDHPVCSVAIAAVADKTGNNVKLFKEYLARAATDNTLAHMKLVPFSNIEIAEIINKCSIRRSEIKTKLVAGSGIEEIERQRLYGDLLTIQNIETNFHYIASIDHLT